MFNLLRHRRPRKGKCNNERYQAVIRKLRRKGIPIALAHTAAAGAIKPKANLFGEGPRRRKK